MNQKVKQQAAAEPKATPPEQLQQPVDIDVHGLSTDSTPIVAAQEPVTSLAIVCIDEEQTQQPTKTSVEDEIELQTVDVDKLPTELKIIRQNGCIYDEQKLEQLAEPSPAINGIQVAPEQSIDCDQLAPTLSPVRSETYTDETQKEAIKSFIDSETSTSVIVDDQVSVTAAEQSAALVSKSVDEKLNPLPISGEDIAIDKKQEAAKTEEEDIPADDVHSQLASETDDSAASSFDEDDQNSSKDVDSTSEPASDSEKVSDNQNNFTAVALPALTLKKEGNSVPVSSVAILDKSAPSLGKPRIKKKRSSKRKKKPRPFIELEAYQVESKEAEKNLSNSEDNCVTGKFDVLSFAGPNTYGGSECVLTREMEPPNGGDPAPITCHGPIWEFL